MSPGNDRSLTGGEIRSLPSLEGLRLISSVVIVGSHYFKYLHLPTRGFQLAVDLFFVISGIVIAMGYEGRILGLGSYIDFVRKRIARLYPLHLATLLFYVAIGVLVASGKVQPEASDKYNFAELVPNLLMIHAWSPSGQISFNYVSWSISAEFFVYICFPLIAYAMAQNYVRSFATFAAILAAALVLSRLITGDDMPDLNWVFGALRAIPSFTLGVWLWVYRRQVAALPIMRSHARLLFALSSAGLLALLVAYPNVYMMLACIYVLVGSAFACDIQGLWTIPAWEPISSRGYLTYSIYMLHTVVATIVISFLAPHILGRSPWAVAASVICASFVTYWLSLLSYWKFEKPVRAYINAIPLPGVFVTRRPGRET